MEQPCYKCGQMAEEGRVFCPHCGAPQIRVIVAEPATVPAGIAPPQTRLTASETVPVIAVPMGWDQAAQPCAVAALIAALGMVTMLINPIVASIGAGFLAVALYRRRNPEIAIHARGGARLGAICGFFCSGMTAVLAALRVAFLHEGGRVRAFLLDIVQQTSVRYNGPQYQQGLDLLRSPAGLLALLAVYIIVALVLLVLLGMLGGALGAASLGRRDRS